MFGCYQSCIGDGKELAALQHHASGEGGQLVRDDVVVFEISLQLFNAFDGQKRADSFGREQQKRVQQRFDAGKLSTKLGNIVNIAGISLDYNKN